MRILRTIQHPDGTMEVIGRLRTRYFVAPILGSLLFFCVAIGFNPDFNFDYKGFECYLFAVFLLVFIVSRNHFIFKPRDGVICKAKFLGILLFRRRISLSQIMDYKIIQASNGSYTLRFLDASLENLLVIEGITSERFANYLTATFRPDDRRLRENYDEYVKAVVKQSRAVSPGITALYVIVTFCIAPLCFLMEAIDLSGIKPDLHVGFGCILSAVAVMMGRPNETIVRVSHDAIERKVRHGLVWITYYRQSLGHDQKCSAC